MSRSMETMAAAKDGRRTEGEGGGGGGGILLAVGVGERGERAGAGEAGDPGLAQGASAGSRASSIASARLRQKLHAVRVVRYSQEEAVRRLLPRGSAGCAAISPGNGGDSDGSAALLAVASAIKSCRKRVSEGDKGGGAERVERSEAGAASLPRSAHRTNKRMELRIEDGRSKEKVEQGDWWLKQVWEQRPGWLRVWNPNLPAFPVPVAQFWEKPCKGDHTALETVANVLTSVPFIVIGLHTHRMAMSTPKLRRKESLRMYGKSVVGVGVASSVYHISRGRFRGFFRWCDYAAIALSTMCLTRTLGKDNHQALMVASAVMLPIQPIIVSALHTSLMENQFLRRAADEPELRQTHRLHAASSLVGGALFVIDDVYPQTPLVHAAWHLAAAVGVYTCNKLLDQH